MQRQSVSTHFFESQLVPIVVSEQVVKEDKVNMRVSEEKMRTKRTRKRP